MVAGNEFECQFAFTYPGIAFEQHPHTQHFQKHPMQSDDFGQALSEMVAQMRHQQRAGLGRSEQGRFGAIGSFDQQRWYGFVVGYDNGGEFGGKQMVDRASQAVFAEPAQIVHFRAAQNLHAVGVNKIQMPYQSQRRFLYSFR